ncbi:putative leucine-rich repeat receptor-like protein kinase [Acorus gramineus]|uniref:non-specific serine/threonine protein kinase n=1 Tax=Acorus gramineus TaxID=55184 RepID=A0AAV9BCX1_ACOGR|nr:putative leucine-rich repeat receptor-like protein kinase [Acorus gramineus]
MAVVVVMLLLRKWFLNPTDGLNGHNKLRHDNDNHSIVTRTYSLEELKKATNDFHDAIGVGATSHVYLAEFEDGTLGAVKRVTEQGRRGSKKVFFDEVSVLLRISHPNLVCLLGLCMEEGEQLLLLEYAPKKSLFHRMHTHHGRRSSNSTVLSWTSRIRIALDVARALDYLHSQADPPIIHCDVKSSNILLMDDDHAKLADFGFCKLGHDQSIQSSSIVKGSMGYIDTNYLMTGALSSKSDVYSFGVLVLELVTGLRTVQEGSTMLAEWTMDERTSGDVAVLWKMLDPRLGGHADADQLMILMDIANLALLHDSAARPDMSYVVERLSSCLETPLLHLNSPV